MNSRIPGFYRLPLDARRAELKRQLDLAEADCSVFDTGGLEVATADRLIENALGVYSLPLGLGLNFRVNDQDFLVPMAVEEPSVIAAASNAAKMVRAGGGFSADADPPVMTAQVEILGVVDPEAAHVRLHERRDELIAHADSFMPRMVERGGGTRAIEVRIPARRKGGGPGLDEANRRVVVHFHIDCRDAMGANLINTVAEAVAARVAEIAGGRSGLRILTNLCDRRLVRVRARVPVAALAPQGADGLQVAREIAAASAFADDDPYRAATHNKGIMNGIDAVVIATGNDWRGVEAGAHAFAAITGQYRPLALWRLDESAGTEAAAGPGLTGYLEMPLAVGTVGGTLGSHAGARMARRILGVSSATHLAMVIASVGLASNLAALRVLAGEGIQRGHMACHHRAVGHVATAVTPQEPGGIAR